MKLNAKFDQSLENIINLCDPLADWFSRNQETMVYYNMTHKDCTDFNNDSIIDRDIIALGKMANIGLSWLEAPKTIPILPKEKAINAALSIAIIYEAEKESLSNEAQKQYYIDLQGIYKEKVEGKKMNRKI